MAAARNTTRLSVLVPAYNEEKTIATILAKLLKLSFVHEIIVVNDCSRDRTLEIAEQFARKSKKVRVYSQPTNQGKTAAIAEAIKHATGDLVIIQDADLEYDPDEIESVIRPLVDGIADVVYGSRFLVRRQTRVLYFKHFMANKFLTVLCNIFTDLNMTDIETGYKAFRAPIIQNMQLTSKGFGMEVEITAFISRLPIRIYETPISYYGRTYEEGKKIGFKDGVMAILYIFYYNFAAAFSRRGREYRAAVERDLALNARGR